MDSVRFEAINSIEIIILLLVIAAIIFILILSPRLNKKKLENKNEHGSSKFADINEIRRKKMENLRMFILIIKVHIIFL